VKSIPLPDSTRNVMARKMEVWKAYNRGYAVGRSDYRRMVKWVVITAQFVGALIAVVWWALT